MSHGSHHAYPEGSRAQSACPLRGVPVPLYQNGPHIDQNALWRDLRTRFGPVAPVEIQPGVAVWLLLGYHENLHVLRDSQHYSRDPRRWREVREGRISLSRANSVMAQHPSAVPQDREAHSRVRAPLVASLARLREGRLFADIQTLANRLIDSFIAEGQADLVGQYATLLPALVLNRLFGLDDEYGYLLGDLTTSTWEPHKPEAARAAGHLRDFMATLTEHKRTRPGADLPSWLMEHPAGLTKEEVVNELLLICTGHEPTTHLIGNSLRRLLIDHEIAVAYGSASLAPADFIDYVMWVDPPLQALAARYPTHDVRIGNARIREGDALLIGFVPAHNDPAVSQRGGGGVTPPQVGNRAHLMWGAGPHACPAQSLARDIATIAVTTLTHRLPQLRLAGAPGEGVRWRNSLFVRGLVDLPVEFAPGTPVNPVHRPAPAEPEHGMRKLVRVARRVASRGARYHVASAEESRRPPVHRTVVVAAGGDRPRAERAGARYHVPKAKEEAEEADPLRVLMDRWRAGQLPD